MKKLSIFSKSLTEVWEWKEHAYEESKHLPRKQAIRKRLKSSLDTVRQLGLKMTDESISIFKFNGQGSV